MTPSSYNRSARILSSGRVVPIQLEENCFWVWFPNAKRGALAAVANYQPVSGPFPLEDERFEILPKTETEAWRGETARTDS